MTVAKEIELKDPLENMGAQMVKEVASKTSDVAGDGTTTATVLAQAIFREGVKTVAADDPGRAGASCVRGVLPHVGRELSGIMEATAFARLESFEDSDDRELVSQDFFLCSLEPFVFTYKTKEQDITDSFARWLDAAVAVAIKEYGDRL